MQSRIRSCSTIKWKPIDDDDDDDDDAYVGIYAAALPLLPTAAFGFAPFQRIEGYVS
jgi:hypothetical protein